jgi:hypothetical protein
LPKIRTFRNFSRIFFDTFSNPVCGDKPKEFKGLGAVRRICEQPCARPNALASVDSRSGSILQNTASVCSEVLVAGAECTDLTVIISDGGNFYRPSNGFSRSCSFCSYM